MPFGRQCHGQVTKSVDAGLPVASPEAGYSPRGTRILPSQADLCDLSLLTSVVVAVRAPYRDPDPLAPSEPPRPLPSPAPPTPPVPPVPPVPPGPALGPPGLLPSPDSLPGPVGPVLALSPPVLPCFSLKCFAEPLLSSGGGLLTEPLLVSVCDGVRGGLDVDGVEPEPLGPPPLPLACANAAGAAIKAVEHNTAAKDFFITYLRYSQHGMGSSAMRVPRHAFSVRTAGRFSSRTLRN